METIENPLIGEKITFLMTSEQSNGSKSVMEVYLSPTGGNPLHYHKRFSETFSIIDGMLNVQIGKQVQTLHLNDSAH